MAKKSSSNKSASILYDRDYYLDALESNPPESIDMAEMIETDYALFAANTMLARHVPQLCDGIKTSLRRLLAAGYGIGLIPSGKRAKSAQVVGEVTKRYHPHSDDAAYGTMICSTQPWRNNTIFFDCDANNGSAYNPGMYAAKRYTNVRLSDFAWDCYFKKWKPDKEFAKDTLTEYQISPLGYREPLIFVARYPVFLFNWNKGYSIGRYTCTPGFNIKEACLAIKKLIDDPDAKIVLYPDDPMGSDIVNKSDLKGLFDAEPGTVSIRIRGRVVTEEINNRTFVRILSVPYEVPMVNIDDKLQSMYSDGGLSEVENIGADSTFDDGDCIDILLKKGANPDAVIDKIYKSTSTSTTFVASYGFVNGFQSRDYTMRIASLEWLRLRRNSIICALTKRLSELAMKVHILEGYIRIIDGGLYDEIMSTIKTNKSKVVKQILIDKMGFTEVQSDYIMSLGLKDLSIDGIESYRKEIVDKTAEYDHVFKIIRHKSNINQIIRDDLDECIEKYGEPRKSKVYDLVDKKYEPLDTQHYLYFTNNKVKKMDYHVAGYKIGRMEAGDKGRLVMDISNKDYIMVVNNKGNCIIKRVDDLSPVSSNSLGVSLSEYGLTGTFAGAVNITEGGSNIVAVTSKGNIIKMIKPNDVTSSSRQTKLMSLNKGDEIVDVVTCDGDDLLFVYTDNGRGIKMSVNEITSISKGGKGVICMKLDDSDSVRGISVVKRDSTNLTVVTDRGYMKNISIPSLPKTKRGDTGIEFNSANGNIVALLGNNKIIPDIGINTTLGRVLIDTNSIKSKHRLGTNDRIIELDVSNYVFGGISFVE